MTRQEKLAVAAVCESEGFDYAFVHYSEFDEIKDDSFHLLRLKFLKARTELAKYIGWKHD